jgi:hypothetical protein
MLLCALRTITRCPRTPKQIFGKGAGLIHSREGDVRVGWAWARLLPFNMYPADGLTSNGGEDPEQVDPWIQAQLSTDQIRWLNNQGSAVSQGDLLKSALAEWVVRHPEDWFQGTRLIDALRAALTEFIDRHKDEFLTLD